MYTIVISRKRSIKSITPNIESNVIVFNEVIDVAIDGIATVYKYLVIGCEKSSRRKKEIITKF